jgi:DNA-binding CsgD family transcriptional regulator/GAF domain-containing protein
VRLRGDARSAPGSPQDPSAVKLVLSPVAGTPVCRTLVVVADRQVSPLAGGDQAEGFALVRFAQSLSGSASIEQLERRFLAGFGRLFGVPMYAYDLVDPVTGRVSCVGAAANISDAFTVRYEREGRDLDPVTAEALATGRPAYNQALMSAEEWLESPVYRTAYHLHGMRHVAEAPVMIGGRLAGTLHFGTSDADRGFVPAQLAMAAEIAALLGGTLRALETQDRLQRERDHAEAALSLTGTAVVVSDPHAGELRLNDAARRLVADVVEADAHLHALIARPADGDTGLTRRAPVELITGETAVLHSRATPAAGQDRGRIAVLELEREHPAIAPQLLAPLTPREREVATLVVEGLSDREIAERLMLSHHTVTQYVKRTYRKLDVDSRVTLTRALLRPPAPARRS